MGLANICSYQLKVNDDQALTWAWAITRTNMANCLDPVWDSILPLCSVVNDNQYSNGICFIVCVCMWPSDKAPLNLDYYKAGLS